MNAKSVILYIGAFKLPDKNAAAHRIVANAKIFRDLGYDVVLVGVDKVKKGLDQQKILRSKSYFGFDCWRVSYPTGMRQWLSYIIDVDVVKQLLEKHYWGRINLVIHYNHPAISQYRSIRLCRKYGIPHVSDITEWYDTSGGPLVWRFIKKIDTALRMNVTNFMEDGLITTSPYITDFYSKKGLKTVELPALFDCGQIDEYFFPIRKEDFLDLIYVCSPLDPKMVNKTRSNLKERLDVIIKLVSDLNNQGSKTGLSVYGNTKSEYMAVFPEHKQILEKFSQLIIFHGKTENSILRKQIASADFSIFIRDENRVTLAGFPVKFGESISIGTPVITNKMVNFSQFEDSGCVIMEDRGNEISALKKAAGLSSSEKINLKRHCRDSMLFHYSSFEPDVKRFFDELGLESNCSPVNSN